MKLDFLGRFFSKNPQISHFTKAVHWKPSCSGRTSRYDEAQVTFAILQTRLKTCATYSAPGNFCPHSDGTDKTSLSFVWRQVTQPSPLFKFDIVSVNVRFLLTMLKKKTHEIFCLGLETRDTQNNALFYEGTGPALKLKNITFWILSLRSSFMQGHPISFKEWSSRTQSPAYYFVIKGTCKQRTELIRPLNSDLECTLSMPQEIR